MNKTIPTNLLAEAFINLIEDIAIQKEAFILLELFKTITNTNPTVRGSIIGFGNYPVTFE